MAKSAASNLEPADHRAGYQDFPNDLAWKASRRWRAAHRFIPISASWIMVCCGIAVAAALMSLFSVLSRPAPMLFLSYPDGTIRCAPAALDPETGRPMARSASEMAVCRQLEFKYGVVGQEAAR